jgi:hypothetical protein
VYILEVRKTYLHLQTADLLKAKILTMLCAFIEGAIDIDGDKPATPRVSRWDRDHFRSDPNR